MEINDFFDVSDDGKTLKIKIPGTHKLENLIYMHYEKHEDIKYLDITESIASGDVKHIISILRRWEEIGYDRLYFDGYNASISLYKSKEKE